MYTYLIRCCLICMTKYSFLNSRTRKKLDTKNSDEHQRSTGKHWLSLVEKYSIASWCITGIFSKNHQEILGEYLSMKFQPIRFSLIITL